MGKKNILRKPMENKGYNDYILIEKNIYNYTNFNFEDDVTLCSDKTFNPLIFQTLLFVLSNRDSKYLDFCLATANKKVEDSNLFESDKFITLMSKGDTYNAYNEIGKITNRVFPNLSKDTYSLYYTTLHCLFEYFDFENYLNKLDNPNRYLKSIFENCFAWTLYVSVMRAELPKKKKGNEEKVNEEHEKYLKERESLINRFKSYKFLEKGISFNCDETRKSEFVSLLNEQFSIWYKEDNSNFEKRNTIESFDFSKYTLDWSLLFTPVEIILEDRPYNVKKENIIHDKETKISKSFEFALKSISGLFSYSLGYVIQYLFLKKSSNFILEINKKNEDIKRVHDEELKTLKSTNRSLTKEMNKFESELKTAQSEIELQKSLLLKVEQQEKDSQELVELKKEVQSLKESLNSDAEELKKSSNKITWQENRISELEFSLKYYENMESDLLELQNINNSLSSQIDQIEKLESLEDSNEEFEKKLKAISEVPILFIGGVGNMMSKFMEMFPNSDYVDISDKGTSFVVSSKYQYVAIYTRVVTHAHCDRAESQIGKDKIIPLNIFNTKLVVEELYKHIIEHKG